MKRETLYTGIGVIVAILIVVYFFFVRAPAPKRASESAHPQNQASSTRLSQDESRAPEAAPATSSSTNSSKSMPQNQNTVVIENETKGTGATALPGDTVAVEYVGKLQNGTVFDASNRHGGPIQFVLGAGTVIPGWDEGIQGMRVGGQRVLIIPPSLGYGDRQVGSIPPNSTLVFNVMLMSVSSSTPQAENPTESL